MATLQNINGYRASRVCGVIAAVFMFGIVLAGVVAEAPVLWREGAGFFMADAGIRLLFGACLAALCAGPYLLVASAAGQGSRSPLLALAAVLMLGLQIWFMVDTLFFNRSSTAAIGLLFLPLYLLVPAAVIWLAATLARKLAATSPASRDPRR